MRTLFFALLLLSLPLTQAFGQAKGNINYQERSAQLRVNQTFNTGINQQPGFTPSTSSYFINDSTVQVGTSVLMNALAESYVAILSINQAGETAKISNERMQSRIDGFKNRLRSIGVNADQVYIDFVSQIPTFDYEIEKRIFSKTANEVPTGFELRKNVHISFEDIATLDQIMILAAEQEIYDLVKVDYNLPQNRLASIYDSLRSTATRLIERKLNNLAVLQIDLSRDNLLYQSFSENLSSVYPVERYSSYKAYSTSALQNDIKIQSKIQKNPTYFYDKVPYNNYEMVINPDILEPAVQFSYTLNVRYSLKKNE